MCKNEKHFWSFFTENTFKGMGFAFCICASVYVISIQNPKRIKYQITKKNFQQLTDGRWRKMRIDSSRINVFSVMYDTYQITIFTICTLVEFFCDFWYIPYTISPINSFFFYNLYAAEDLAWCFQQNEDRSQFEICENEHNTSIESQTKNNLEAAVLSLQGSPLQCFDYAIF